MPTDIKQVNKTDARQGRSGMGVRYVLIGGLALVIVAFIIVYVAGRVHLGV